MGYGAVYYAVIVGERQVDHAANGYRVVNYYGALFDCAEAENRDVWLIDYWEAEQAAEDAGVGDGKVPSATSSGLSFFARALSARSFMVRAMPRKFFSSAFLITGTIRPQSSATAMPMLHSLCRMMLVPSTEAFTVGKARRASTAARTKKGMKVSLVPLVSSNFAFI